MTLKELINESYYYDKDGMLFLGDCVEWMKKFPNECVDLVITSPPYDKIRDYKKDKWQIDLPAVGQQISRVLKNGGICVMVIQDQTKDGRKSGTSFKTIVNWIDNTELDLWETCIYARSGTPGAWWDKRFRVDHEYMPIFIKGKRPQYFNKEHMKELTKPEYGLTKKGLGNRKTDGTTVYDTNKVYELPKEKYQGTIIHYKNSSRETPKSSVIGKIKLQHPATFPDKIASDFIQCFTKENMIVLDPMVGSGTVVVESNKLNRKYIGIDTNEEYLKNICIKRLKSDQVVTK